MSRIRKALLGVATTAVAVSSTLVLAAAPAHAEVWDCHGNVNYDTNQGEGFCFEGFGSYRVRTECNSGHWPYTRNIDGPVVYKSSGGHAPVSVVNGTPNGCHVVKAWVVAV
jgi:hypothetical protein